MDKRNSPVLLVVLMSFVVVAAQDSKEALSTTKAANKEPGYGQGIDTLDVETSGNWLQKRVIWEDAQRKYEKIQAAEHDVLDDRLSLFEKRSSSDKKLNVFYSATGFDQGELEETIDTLLVILEKMKNTMGSLTEKEKEIQAKLYEHKSDLEQLKKDVKTLTDLDEALDKAVMQLVNQVSLSGDYERQAWQQFKAIGQELDDRKAKASYLEMDALEKNIRAIDDYVKGSLAQYFEKLDGSINELTSKIDSKIKSLQQSGIDIKNQINELEEAKKEKPKKVPAEKKAPTGWFANISSLVTGWFSSISSIVTGWFATISSLATRLWYFMFSFFGVEK